MADFNRGATGAISPGAGGDPKPQFSTDANKTGISTGKLTAKSAVSVSIDANDAGEHLPLVYVLICQKVA